MDDLSDTVETYESVADRYAERHADRGAVHDQRERFVDALDPGPGTAAPRVLDAGCGPGWETAYFTERGCSVLAIDLTPSFLAATRRRAPGADVARMDMRRPGLAPASFDGIWACASFLHVSREEAPATLRRFAHMLRSGGVLNCSVRRGSGEVTGDTYDGDRRRFTLYEPDELRGLVEAAGLRVERLDADEWVVVLARKPE